MVGVENDVQNRGQREAATSGGRDGVWALAATLVIAMGCGSTDIMGNVTGDGSTDPDVAIDPSADDGADVPPVDEHWILRFGDGTQNADDVLVLGDDTILVTGHQWGAYGTAACWLLKVSADGTLLGQWTVSDLDCSRFRSSPAADGGAVVVAPAWGEGDQDLWVARVRPDLSMVWQQFLDSAGDQRYAGVAGLSEGRLLVVAVDDGSGDSDDLMVTMLEAGGEVAWSRSVGTPGREEFAGQALAEGPGGRIYIAAGTADPVHRYLDVLLLALDADGEPLWQRFLGEPYHDGASDMLVDAEGITIVGQTDESELSDCASWVVRLNHDGEVLWQTAFNAGGCDAAVWIVSNPAGGATLGGNYLRELDDGIDYQVWIATMDETGRMGPPLHLGDEHMQFPASGAALGADVVTAGWHDATVGELHHEMFVARVGADATFGLECPLAHTAGMFETALVEVGDRDVDLPWTDHEVRVVPTARTLQPGDRPWTLVCP